MSVGDLMDGVKLLLFCVVSFGLAMFFLNMVFHAMLLVSDVVERVSDWLWSCLGRGL